MSDMRQERFEGDMTTFNAANAYFAYRKLDNGNFEVVMIEGKVRQFAVCTHENDAEVIVDALNAARKRGEL